MANKPIMKYPKNPLAKWPPTGGIPYPASAFASWWTAAEACSRDNVWDVIYFNFQTTDGAEVNYYMANLLGCNVLTKNKKDFKFARKDAMPITIYLPPPGWQMDPSVGVPPKPQRPPMGFGDVAAAQIVLSTLGSAPMGWINFHIGPYHINTLEFRKIADRIRSGTFAVYRLPGDAEKAEYDPEANALHIRFGWDIVDKANIVHEAVHAIFDLKKACNIFTLDDEAAAYLAESLYAQAYVLPSDRRQLVGRYEEDQAIFMQSYLLARSVLEGAELGDADFDPLRNAIANHSEYKAGSRGVAAYDGVYEMGPVH
ncbi:hypothetical protein V5E97_07915 [Singulisphaera sp. Ch08]|uniref:Uncharacterized protein n=1 Tax=Singulisphaera sp. Ch08 TaxID=3120278 RepID=A0AAU7CKA9_9BACT